MIGVSTIALETYRKDMNLKDSYRRLDQSIINIKGYAMARLRLTDTTVDSMYQSYKRNGNVIWESTRSASFKTKNLEFVEASNGYYDIYGSVEAIEALTNYWKQQAEKDSE